MKLRCHGLPEAENQLQAILNKPHRAAVDLESCLRQIDTLWEGINALQKWQVEKDSLCNEAVGNLELQVINRDSVIENQENRFQETKLALEQSLQPQDVVSKENRQYRKQLKRQKFRNTVKTVGAVLLSAITLKFLLTP